MTTFQDLQAEHEALLNRHEAPADPAQFWADVQSFIDRVRNDAQYISAPRERDQLRAILRFWASYVYDQTKTYPDTTMRPADVPPPPPPPPPSGPHRTPVVVWAIAALAILAVVVAVFLGASYLPSVQMLAATATSQPQQPQSVGTEVPGAEATPTLAAAQVVPLDVDYQILTQGPSPFDATVWVIKLWLVGIGGNSSYIYWVDGQQLPGDEYTIQGKSCEPQALSIGVTSSGQAVKRDIKLLSPLVDCPK
jgi:hypothetical protein